MNKLKLEERLDEVWKHCQRGLVYPSPFATFATFWTKKPESRLRLAQLMAKFREEINTNDKLANRNTSVVLGVSFHNWAAICKADKLPLPKGMHLNFPSDEDKYISDVFDASKGVFKDSKGDLWFHIKSDDEHACKLLLDMVIAELKDNTKDHFAQAAASKSDHKDGHNGKVLGCRFPKT